MFCFEGRDPEQTNLIRNTLTEMFSHAPRQLDIFTKACGIDPDWEVDRENPLDHIMYSGRDQLLQGAVAVFASLLYVY